MTAPSFVCPLCSGTGSERLAAYRARNPVFRGRDIVRCRSCGFVSAHPMPSEAELARFYQTYWAGHERGRPDLALFQAQATARFRFMEDSLPPGRDGVLAVLDVGAGFGLIRDVLWQARGGRPLRYDAVETDPDAAAYLRDRTGADHVYRDLAGAGGPYDVAILSHIVEHVRDPLALLGAVRERVVPGGLVFVETPNRDDRFKRRNDPHVLFFAPETVTEALRLAGLRPLRVETCGERIDAILDRERRAAPRSSLLRAARRAARRVRRAFAPGAPIAVHRPPEASEVDRTGPGRRWVRAVAARDGGP